MKPDNKFMLELTASMPCKQINVNERPYMQRMYAGTFINANIELDLWFHRFLSADGDNHLHWHSMNMRSGVVLGWYKEEFLRDGIKEENSLFYCNTTRNYLINLCAAARNGYPLRRVPNNTRDIKMHDIHRIAEIGKDTWTVLFVEPERVPVWGFIDDNGDIETRPTSGRYWWKDFLPRGQNSGDVCT